MGKAKPITDKDIEGARDVVNRFGVVNVSRLPRADQEYLIRTRYGNSVRRKPISEMGDSRVYMIAQSVYDRSYRILNQLEEGTLERRVLI